MGFTLVFAYGLRVMGQDMHVVVYRIAPAYWWVNGVGIKAGSTLLPGFVRSMTNC